MEQMSRIDIQIPLSVRAVIDRAAAIQGRTRSDFLISSAHAEAERVIARHSLIELSPRDQEMLARALADESVEEPDDFIKRVAQEYKEKVKSS